VNIVAIALALQGNVIPREESKTRLKFSGRICQMSPRPIDDPVGYPCLAFPQHLSTGLKFFGRIRRKPPDRAVIAAYTSPILPVHHDKNRRIEEKAMLTYLLAFTIALASIGLYAMTFFLPAFKREQDLIWSGVGLFYALVLWICAGQVRGGLLLGQMASVALIGWLGWQAFEARWGGLSAAEKDQAKVLTEIKAKFSNIDFDKLGDQAKGLANKAKDSAAGLADKAKDVAGNVADKAKDVAADVSDKAKDVAADVKDTAKDAAPKSSEPYVRKAFQDTAEAVKDTVAATTETVKEVASDVVETAVEEIKDAAPDA
jgi:hypothetical protein